MLPLYHQISGCGVPDAEQAITVVSPMPMRISLKATVTTGDSREGESSNNKQNISIREKTNGNGWMHVFCGTHQCK